ncbi:MAG: DNA-directed RNA polymerase, beta subunit [Candidatus Xenolissoclinum pacificiensis L6]|uniref:DNA-directed RNA polymerase subunit beta n=1 Tax=Candidatus Xenolissoclinum pacificiensis L6 TaxID=1401685 RepID=W2V0K0_9RICK|nr:MAG: DNA-directed RNA polymerase, beta subunit [Candidatus Xenolissoclinum pacificiensis L6]
MSSFNSSIVRLFESENDFFSEQNLFGDLIKIQRDSYNAFITDKDNPNGIFGIFKSIFPIHDGYGRLTLDLVSCKLDDPRYNEEESLIKGVTYSCPFSAVLRLTVWDLDSVTEKDKLDKSHKGKKVKEVKEQLIHMGEMPIMTCKGTFVINGTERVVVSQMHRAPGIFFDNDDGKTYSSNKLLYFARVIPYRGSWLDIEFDGRDVLFFRIDKKRKLPFSYLLKALKMSDEDILDFFYRNYDCHYNVDTSRWEVQYDPVFFANTRLSYDLVNVETGEVVLKSGVKISNSLANKLSASLKKYSLASSNLAGRYLSAVPRMSSGVVASSDLSVGGQITLDQIDILIDKGVTKLSFFDIDNISVFSQIRDTIFLHPCTYEEAILEIYKVMKPGEVSTFSTAVSYFNSLFFDSARYDLLNVGRVRLNARLKLHVDESVTILTVEDILETSKELINLQNKSGEVDDIDHLGNRRIRSVGEFIENQFRVGLLRMEKLVKEYMVTTSDFNTVVPCDLVNSKIVVTVIREFFVSSQLSQFMDQTNPLSEITHKRRLSALGPGGLTRERAGFEVRDVHPSHYGRICPIETPEGQNIGLINSLATYARINSYGFIESPYRRVRDGVVTEDIQYLSAIEEGKYNVAQSVVKVKTGDVLPDDSLYCHKGNDIVMVNRMDVDFIDVAPKQIVSIAASLIPFLEKDDANRALMGSNMQRQAVPLLSPRKPLVGTGMEYCVARGSESVVVAKRSGIVRYVDASNIMIASIEKEEEGFWVDSYSLKKFGRSNHNTCINQVAIVKVGDCVVEGQTIADGSATHNSELALGNNVVVAFLGADGYNFEDSIVVGENLLHKDVFTSIHVEEYECVRRETKLGPEVLTRDIPNISEELLYHLDEYGIVHVGAEVTAGDVLVGKVTPKGESPMTPEEKLLKAVFGGNMTESTDTSLTLPSGVAGTIIDVRILSRKGIEKDGRALIIENQEVEQEVNRCNREVKIVNDYTLSVLKSKLLGHALLKDVYGFVSGTLITEEVLYQIGSDYWWDLPVTNSQECKSFLEGIKQEIDLIRKKSEARIEKIKTSDTLSQGILCIVKVFVAVKNKLEPGDKMSGRHGNKGVISKVVPVEDMPYLSDGTVVDVLLNPLGVPSRMNIGQTMEAHLGWASFRLGKKIQDLLSKNKTDEIRSLLLEIYKTHSIVAKLSDMTDQQILDYAFTLCDGIPMAAPVFESPSEEEIIRLLQLSDADPTGQEVLYSGITGEPFDRKVTVGNMYLLKLNHLVSDKMHARSVGPYSLITQQPLGGKSHFGGQRCGEMEGWAFQAYGASYLLHETLTVRSDDVVGRVKMYESIVRGENNFCYGIPESFHVMINELKALCLNVELINVEHDEILENSNAGHVVPNKDAVSDNGLVFDLGEEDK